MGILQWDGNDDQLEWTIDAAIGAIPTGAQSVAFGVRCSSIDAWRAMPYLRTASGDVAKCGLSWTNTLSQIIHDYATNPGYGDAADLVANTDLLYVMSKATGTTTPTLSKQQKGGAMSHTASGSTLANQTAADRMLFGRWPGGTDYYVGHAAFLAWWDVELSQSQREACGTSWKTSDVYNAVAGTPPLALVEFNVAAANLVNIGSASISSPNHTGTSLDSGQTFSDWNFDGKGLPSLDELDLGRFPKPKLASLARVA